MELGTAGGVLERMAGRLRASGSFGEVREAPGGELRKTFRAKAHLQREAAYWRYIGHTTRQAQQEGASAAAAALLLFPFVGTDEVSLRMRDAGFPLLHTAEWLRRSDDAALATFVGQLRAMLCALHREAGVEHRDLGPLNVLVRELPQSAAAAARFVPAIVDYSNACIPGHERLLRRERAWRVLRASPVVRSPEETLGLISPPFAHDAWAMGALLVYLLLGRARGTTSAARRARRHTRRHTNAPSTFSWCAESGRATTSSSSSSDSSGTSSSDSSGTSATSSSGGSSATSSSSGGNGACVFAARGGVGELPASSLYASSAGEGAERGGGEGAERGAVLGEEDASFESCESMDLEDDEDEEEALRRMPTYAGRGSVGEEEEGDDYDEEEAAEPFLEMLRDTDEFAKFWGTPRTTLMRRRWYEVLGGALPRREGDPAVAALLEGRLHDRALSPSRRLLLELAAALLDEDPDARVVALHSDDRWALLAPSLRIASALRPRSEPLRSAPTHTLRPQPPSLSAAPQPPPSLSAAPQPPSLRSAAFHAAPLQPLAHAAAPQDPLGGTRVAFAVSPEAVAPAARLAPLTPPPVLSSAQAPAPSLRSEPLLAPSLRSEHLLPPGAHLQTQQGDSPTRTTTPSGRRDAERSEGVARAVYFAQESAPAAVPQEVLSLLGSLRAHVLDGVLNTYMADQELVSTCEMLVGRCGHLAAEAGRSNLRPLAVAVVLAAAHAQGVFGGNTDQITKPEALCHLPLESRIRIHRWVEDIWAPAGPAEAILADMRRKSGGGARASRGEK